MFSFLASIGYKIFKALEASEKARARRYFHLHRGEWQ